MSRRLAGFLREMPLNCREKNCWTIAQNAGDVTPDGKQNLLNWQSREDGCHAE